MPVMDKNLHNLLQVETSTIMANFPPLIILYLLQGFLLGGILSILYRYYLGFITLAGTYRVIRRGNQLQRGKSVCVEAQREILEEDFFKW